MNSSPISLDREIKYFKSLKRYDEDHNYDLDSSGNPITDDDYKIETGLIAQHVMKIPELSYLVDEVEDKNEVYEEEEEKETDDGIEKVKVKKERVAIKSRYVLNYQDIFVYNIKATQELDRQQQADKAKIASLETKVASLESELAAIKSHLGL